MGKLLSYEQCNYTWEWEKGQNRDIRSGETAALFKYYQPSNPRWRDGRYQNTTEYLWMGDVGPLVLLLGTSRGLETEFSRSLILGEKIHEYWVYWFNVVLHKLLFKFKNLPVNRYERYWTVLQSCVCTPCLLASKTTFKKDC